MYIQGVYHEVYIGWYTSLPTMPPSYLVGILASLLCLPVYTPGYTIVHTVPHTTGYTAAPRPACVEGKPWALRGRKPWVEASRDPKSPKGVTDGGRLCAGCSPLSLVIG